MNKAPLIGISRLRMGTDGHGVTTLVAFHGCPLRCKYCLNPQCFKTNEATMELTPEELYQRVKRDELYFIATRGGVTFGGGEPMLRSGFIKDFLELGAKKWHTTIETSLNIDRRHLIELKPYIDHYIVDIKDMNPKIYKEYTSVDNYKVICNLKWLVNEGLADKVTIRIPQIIKHNDSTDQAKSKSKLQAMGFRYFDLFEYRLAKGFWKNRRMKNDLLNNRITLQGQIVT